MIAMVIDIDDRAALDAMREGFSQIIPGYFDTYDFQTIELIDGSFMLPIDVLDIPEFIDFKMFVFSHLTKPLTIREVADNEIKNEI